MPCMVNKDFSPSLVRTWIWPSPELSLGNLQLPAYQRLFVAFHPMQVDHSFQQRVKETSIHIPGDNFLGSTLLSITLPFMLQTLQLPWTKIYVSSTPQNQHALLTILLPVPWFRVSFQEESWGNHRAHLICLFLSEITILPCPLSKI